MWQKEKLLVLSNFFFCHYVFKKLSAAEASESVYTRERVKDHLPSDGLIGGSSSRAVGGAIAAPMSDFPEKQHR